MGLYGYANETVSFPGLVTLRTTAPDPWQNSPSGYGSYLIPNGQKAPLGTAYVDNIPTQITTTTTPALVSVTNVNGYQTKYRYVQYASTANTAVVAAPAPVFWVDRAKTKVTSTMSESLTASQASIAGWMMANACTVSGAGGGSAFTAAVLQPASGQGGYIWIAVAGYVGGAAAAASIAAGDWLIGGASAWVPVRVAEGTSTGYKVGAQALTAVQNVSGSVTNTADIYVLCESL